MEGSQLRKRISPEDVKKIFVLRSQGKPMREIGEKYETSDVSIGRIINRQIFKDDPVPDDLVEKCQNMGKIFPKKQRKKKAVGTRAGALADYTEACYAIKDSKRACRSFGVSEDTMKLLMASVIDGI